MKPLVICIGANKTGTTSLNAFFEMNGFRCGNQMKGEMLVKDYAAGNWQPIVDFVGTADFFQDIPFSARHTYRHIFPAYPSAKFILSRRQSADEWYTSLVRFHAGRFGDGLSAPTADQLRKATYRYPGFVWEAHCALFGTPDDNPYHYQSMIDWYETHLQEVRTFFAGRPEQLLEIEISDPLAATKIAIFAGFENTATLPHLNKWPVK